MSFTWFKYTTEFFFKTKIFCGIIFETILSYPPKVDSRSHNARHVAVRCGARRVAMGLLACVLTQQMLYSEALAKLTRFN